jgi:glycosyltransferase involved in cell wall biosynthesis
MNGIIEKLLGLFAGKEKAPSGKKVLHVGNVANLAYVNAKVLNAHGFENHVAAPDFYHFASSPQWQELIGSSVTRDDLGDDWHPNFFKVASASGLMPDWVAQGPTHLVVTYLYLKATNDSRADLAHEALEYYRMKSAILGTTLPQATRLPEVLFREALESYPLKSSERMMLRRGREADTVFENFRRVIASIYGDETAKNVAPPFAYQNAVAYAGVDPNLNSKWLRLNGTGEAAALGIVMADALTKPRVSCPPGVLEDDFNAYAISLPWWKGLFDAYDHIILYGSSAILGLLTGSRYIALEHGNIRDIPFRDDALGRLTRVAYQRADAVLITNSDYVIAKPRLEFEDGRRHYLPHPMEDELLENYRKRNSKLQSEDGNIRFFSPARQDWERNDPSLSKGNDRVVRAVANLKRRCIENIRVTFVDWGRDADATRELIKSLNLEDQFRWTRPLAKGDLWKAYLESHAVIDQFFLDAFGGVTYEALALGRRVITRDDGVANVEFFEGKPPPLLSAATVTEISNRMYEVAKDPADSKGIGEAGREWITERHSAHRIGEIIGRVFDRVAEIGSPAVDETAAVNSVRTRKSAEPMTAPDPQAAVLAPGPMVAQSIAAEEVHSNGMEGPSRDHASSGYVQSISRSGKAASRKPAPRKTASRKPAAKRTANSKATTEAVTGARKRTADEPKAALAKATRSPVANTPASAKRRQKKPPSAPKTSAVKSPAKQPTLTSKTKPPARSPASHDKANPESTQSPVTRKASVAKPEAASKASTAKSTDSAGPKQPASKKQGTKNLVRKPPVKNPASPRKKA